MLFFKNKKKQEKGFVPVVLPDPIDPNAPRTKVLILDDDAVTVKALTMVLTPRGYDVLSAADGSQAISVINQQNPDVMLVDVSLAPDVGTPLCDGFQVIRWLQRANARKIPAIVISASDKPAYKKQAAAIGADGFLAKPLDKDQLIELIEAARVKVTEEVAEEFPSLKMAEGPLENFAS